MRSALFLILALSCLSISWAQAPAPAQAASEQSKPPTSATAGAVEKRTERIHIEDSGASIDELRVGGETKTIDVKPKGGMPAYQVQPASGERSWKILGF
jgi:hypothetical protein